MELELLIEERTLLLLPRLDDVCVLEEPGKGQWGFQMSVADKVTH